MKIKAELESNAGLMPAERQALHTLLIRVYATLDEVEAAVRAVFPAWFIYRGGSHVALHVKASSRAVESPRLAIWTEAREDVVDYAEHETLGFELAVPNAYRRGQRFAEKHWTDANVLDKAEATAARYEHRQTEDAFLEGFNDRRDEMIEGSLENAAELGEG